jgi:hypothetical protein
MLTVIKNGSSGLSVRAEKMELNRKFAQVIANFLNEENKKGLNREWTPISFCVWRDRVAAWAKLDDVFMNGNLASYSRPFAVQSSFVYSFSEFA